MGVICSWHCSFVLLQYRLHLSHLDVHYEYLNGMMHLTLSVSSKPNFGVLGYRAKRHTNGTVLGNTKRAECPSLEECARQNMPACVLSDLVHLYQGALTDWQTRIKPHLTLTRYFHEGELSDTTAALWIKLYHFYTQRVGGEHAKCTHTLCKASNLLESVDDNDEGAVRDACGTISSQKKTSHTIPPSSDGLLGRRTLSRDACHELPNRNRDSPVQLRLGGCANLLKELGL